MKLVDLLLTMILVFVLGKTGAEARSRESATTSFSMSQQNWLHYLRFYNDRRDSNLLGLNCSRYGRQA